ncbi:MAG: hypothetical protein OER95_06100 [Acidimicrobiia bacterium]|nr:hypothetical protein [Acidimicrobiia bacterium]
MALTLVLILVLSACQTSGADSTTEAGASEAGAVQSAIASEPVGETNDEDSASGADESSVAQTPDDSVDDGPSLNGVAIEEPDELAADDQSAATVGGSWLAQALARAGDATSFAFEGSLTIESATGAGQDGMAITFNGAHDRTADATSVTIDLSALGQLLAEDDGGDDLVSVQMFFADPIQLIVIGDTSWVNWDLFGMFVPTEHSGGDSWIEMAAEDGGAVLDDLSAESGLSDPTALLDALGKSTAASEELGPDVVRGTKVTRHRLRIDLEELADALPAEQQAELDGELAAEFASLPVDVWVDDENRLRRISLSLTDPTGLDGLEIGAATLEIELFDYGQPMGIEPPPADQILTEEDLGFSFSEDG